MIERTLHATMGIRPFVKALRDDMSKNLNIEMKLITAISTKKKWTAYEVLTKNLNFLDLLMFLGI